MITTRQNWLRTDPRSARRIGYLLGLVTCAVVVPIAIAVIRPAADPRAALAELRIAAQLDPKYPGIGALIAEAREALAQPKGERPPEDRPADGMPPGAARPVVPEHATPKRLSLHAAPAGDTAALNADVERRLPSALAQEILPDDHPGVVIFLKADCECSKGFAITATALAPHLQPFAACTAVIEGTTEDAEAFVAATGLAIPFIAQPESTLAQEWGVTKAGCFALVKPDGSVEAVWPGISRQGFRDLAGRLGVEPPLPETLLAEIPGAAMAGCPLEYVALGPATVPALPPRAGLSQEPTR